MSRVLIVDDERKMRRVLQIMLEQMGLSSSAAESAEEALQLMAGERFDLVMTDLKMPGLSGVELLARIRESDRELPVIVLTAHGTISTAVQAMKHGAFDFVLKPFEVAELETTIRNALEMRRFRTENRYLREQLSGPPGLDDLVGQSAVMRSVFELVRQIAPTRSSVLITGETGTGKELVARALHRLSPRNDRLFVALNCAAIPADLLETELFGHTRGAFTGAQAERAGKFELADGGTLFLDEIGDMAYPLQAKLLRVLQEGTLERVGSNRSTQVDVRVISSTNRDLGAAMRDGRFRDDLYYRLNVFHIHLPPLRERLDDTAPMAQHFLDGFAAELGKQLFVLSKDAERALQQYPWPGNVRELRNVMERAAVLCRGQEVDAALLRNLLELKPTAAVEPTHINGEETSLRLDDAVESVEKRLILRALGAAKDNKAEASRLLGVSERTLWYKLKRYAL